jgi:AraC-like DNA-binding protein
LWLIYVEPETPLARALCRGIDTRTVSQAPPPIAKTARRATSPATWMAALEATSANDAARIDPRLAHALTALGDQPGTLAIAEAAARSRLSPSRLRVLARTQLGVPLATWLLWRKLIRAGQAIASGDTLADAATHAGFADQAHMSRAMRRMFGVTPRAAAVALSR